MANPRTFGRRADQRPVPNHSAPARRDTAPVLSVENSQPALGGDPVDDELREWKRARGKGHKIAWRQLSLMAGLCFGIASFVLPAWLNSTVQWPLYGLAAMSFYVGLRKKKGARK
jgi:hypothetical protein